MDNLKFSALLCSRLCHDLASPLGAINNGVEMLATETDPSLIRQITGLIEQSARQTTNRLQYYRLAFGAGSGLSSQVGLGQAKAAMEAFFGDQKIELEFDPGQRTASPAVVKLLMNLALTAGETIIRGGKLVIEIEDQAPGTRLALRAEADKIKVRDTIADALAGRLAEEDLDSKLIPAVLAAEIASALGTSINLADPSAGGFSLAVDVPAAGPG
ncbi:MAG: histidine phosphotransferase [Proteobacteria bacterium]|nr:histidine phosphotransferase [Pseudomonadota bacterium]